MLDYLLQLLQFVWLWIVSYFFGPVITMDDTGIRVRCQNQIAEGGFSVIFLATDVDDRTATTSSTSRNKYVLKRIRCHDSERIPSTTTESTNDSLSSHFMPLLGTTFSENNTVCYMLFPYISHSLKKEIDRRIFQPFEEMTNGNRSTILSSQSQKNKIIRDALTMPPWSETVVLRWFEQLIDAVILMHDAGYTHRDIKIDNVLLHPEPPLANNNNYSGSNNSQSGPGPILMDFGSAGPLTRPLTRRRDILDIADDAAVNTTISYRPPELFAGELRVADSILDYRKVDVWMLGCTLFAILFGASPGEVEFSRSTGKLIIVDSSHNKVLGSLPWPNDETPPAHWYSKDVKELLEWILTQSRCDRPTVTQVRRRVRELLSQQPTFFHDGRDGRMATDLENQHVDISFASKNSL
ncbi:kinase-like protein [Fragilariopsis cylindrus CCMP1102]|uniref:non-specific serine/threonine protein kinase n=1 Tax=Fragilariopsis cylindrus CCMP1102 TaxID=635003 RepID=A0A1E7FXQ7_9STRA|nr:kinase-like protein [Fragilariopsis cylindrus CCMP1102]|eukprot:OEU22942.1 kinase-like protein [Fragilariopsis cylindrus CCMP1102]